MQTLIGMSVGRIVVSTIIYTDDKAVLVNSQKGLQ